ncbi:hypothetical protein [Robbsia andropogonis]|nr:hypothetical protein [Robbsia andropogonis]MCP1120918.1 hypothetical protein [Robbsia andropogonis]MCP1130708.1 hypothetical protein [Robbsia andropogonis]
MQTFACAKHVCLSREYMRLTLARTDQPGQRRHSLPADFAYAMPQVHTGLDDALFAIEPLAHATRVTDWVTDTVRFVRETHPYEQAETPPPPARCEESAGATASTNTLVGRETPPPSYQSVVISRHLPASVPPPQPTLPAPPDPLVQSRRDALLALASRRGEDLDRLDPPPSYRQCMGEPHASEAETSAEFARSARALNRHGSRSDIEALVDNARRESCFRRNRVAIILLVTAFFAFALPVIIGFLRHHYRNAQ